MYQRTGSQVALERATLMMRESMPHEVASRAPVCRYLFGTTTMGVAEVGLWEHWGGRVCTDGWGVGVK